MAKRSNLSIGIQTIGRFTRNNLERVGSIIDGVNAKTGKPRQYKVVNLGDEDYQQDLFREQTLKTTQQLLGPRFATYGKFAKKVVPNSLFQTVVDSGFVQVAKLASNWSQLDLPSEHRFANISTLDNEQRYALATDIANQNRALATLGGLTGLAGLPGLLADTLWLLLVSLRTVYQLAAVYDKPLTGKQGIKAAYELLANADLSKMQEKQALLAGIGVGKGLLDSAQSRGLHSELQNLGLKNQNVNFYAEQVDRIAEQIGLNLDNIDLSWVRRFLPISAVVVGMRYNSRLIDEVIGVAQATFAPEPKLANRAITDDSKSEAEVPKTTAAEKSKDTQKSKDAQKPKDIQGKDTQKKDNEKNADKPSDSKTDKPSAKSSEKANDSDKAADKEENQVEAADIKKSDSKKSDNKKSGGKSTDSKKTADDKQKQTSEVKADAKKQTQINNH